MCGEIYISSTCNGFEKLFLDYSRPYQLFVEKWQQIPDAEGSGFVIIIKPRLTTVSILSQMNCKDHLNSTQFICDKGP